MIFHVFLRNPSLAVNWNLLEFVPIILQSRPTAGSCVTRRWNADFIRKRGDLLFFRDVREHIDRRGSSVSAFLAQAVISGKVRNLGHLNGTSRGDILLHVCTHAQYTLAQVVNMLKQAGAEKLPETMLIALARLEAT